MRIERREIRQANVGVHPISSGTIRTGSRIPDRIVIDKLEPKSE